MKRQCKCRFCSLYSDKEGRCALRVEETHTLDEKHDCFFANRSMDSFNSLLTALNNVAKELSNIENVIGRCVNTDKEKELIERFSSVRELAESTVNGINERPEEYREIQECLGTCGNCKNLDTSKSGFKDGRHIYGACKYAPIAYNGEIHETNWRGCAKWSMR